MKMSITEYAEACDDVTLLSIPVEGDDSVTIADLAQFVTFDHTEAQTQQTAPWCIAYGELLAEYGNNEMTGGQQDFYDGFFMQFADGSELRFIAH